MPKNTYICIWVWLLLLDNRVENILLYTAQASDIDDYTPCPRVHNARLTELATELSSPRQLKS